MIRSDLLYYIQGSTIFLLYTGFHYFLTIFFRIQENFGFFCGIFLSIQQEKKTKFETFKDISAEIKLREEV